MGRRAIVRSLVIEELELPFPPAEPAGVPAPAQCEPFRNPLGTFACCPMCGGGLAPEHAHFRCRDCGWRDSCCD